MRYAHLAPHTAVGPSASRAFGARISAVSRKLNALGGKPAAAAAPTKQPPALSSDVAVIDWSAGAVAATTCVRAKTAHMPATRRSVGSSSAAEVHETCNAASATNRAPAAPTLAPPATGKSESRPTRHASATKQRWRRVRARRGATARAMGTYGGEIRRDPPKFAEICRDQSDVDL